MRDEDRLVEWLRRRLGRRGESLLGDDAALIDRPERWAISVDQQIEGTHFAAGLDPGRVGRRLVAVCLSDLAASGAEPAYAFLTVALPPGYPAERLLDGVLAACRRYGVELAGGDTAASRDRLHCSLTVLGRRRPRGRWLRRTGARPGDRLWLGGTIGESALGRRLLEAGARLDGRAIALPPDLRVGKTARRLARRAIRRHLLPVPQLELGARLAGRRRVAAIDVSDGLAIDLHRLCRASGVGAEVERPALPAPHGLDACARALGVDPDELCLAGGEDYVLLFTLPARSRPPAGTALARIGTISERPGIRLHDGSRATALPPLGWDHLADR